MAWGIDPADRRPMSAERSTAGPDELREALERLFRNQYEGSASRPSTKRRHDYGLLSRALTSLAEGAQPERGRTGVLTRGPEMKAAFEEGDRVRAALIAGYKARASIRHGVRAVDLMACDILVLRDNLAALRSAAPAAGTRIEGWVEACEAMHVGPFESAAHAIRELASHNDAMDAVGAAIDAREQSDAARWLEGEMAENDGWSITVPYQYAAALRDAIRNHPAAPTGAGSEGKQ